MRRLARLSVFLPVVLVGCRDDVVDPSDVHFEPQCDQQGPVELLRLGDDEVVGRVARVGDEVDGDIHAIVISTDDSQGDASTWRRDVVVDRCGEEVTELASNPSYLTRWGPALVGCVDSDLVRFSGYYDDPSPTLLARRGCAARAVDGDLWVTIEAEPGATEGRLVSLELDGSGVQVREVLDGIVVGGPGTLTIPTVIDERVFVRTTDFALVSASPRTNDVRIELEQADAWSAHPHALAYRAPVVHPDELTPLIVRDRRTGAEQTLDAEIPASWRFGWVADGVLAAGPPPSLTYRWFRLDPLRELVPPEGTRIEAVRSDGLVWLSQLDETNGDTSFFRWREGEAPQRASTCTYCAVIEAYRGDFIEVMVQTRYEHLVDLWRIDDDGGPARPLASAAHRDYHVMGDDRVLTVPAGHSFDHGPLELHDGSGGPAVTLAPRVHRHAAGLTWLYHVPDEILYEAVPSASHGTHALFRAKLSP